MDMGKALAAISLAGFAVQRMLEVLDPLLFFLASRLKKIQSPELPESTVKGWLAAVLGFLISVPIAYLGEIKIVTEKSEWGWVNVITGALAISAGSNGLNSALKLAEKVKNALKGSSDAKE
jgi:hypothetical protein